MLCVPVSRGSADERNSVTVTSILRVTAVANSVHNQKDQTWHFIPRGVWTLIEANLGIICSCLIVLRRPLAGLLSKMFGPTKTSTSEGYRYGYSSKGVALGIVDSSQRDLRRTSTRHHTKLEDMYDYEDALEDSNERRRRIGREDLWTGRSSFQITGATYRGDAETARRSDERYILATNDTENDASQRSMASTDEGEGYPSDIGLAVTKEANIHVEALPPSLARQAS